MNKPQTICIIDIDAVYQYNIIRQTLGKKLLTFSNSDDALYYLTENAHINSLLPDIIFMHINRPLVNAWEFMTKYPNVQPLIKKKIAIYILSDSANPSDLATAKRFADASDYIIKPSEGTFLDCISYILEKESALI